MIIVCQHCGYKWNYTGNAMRRARASCPECYSKVKIPWIGTEQRSLAVLSLALILVGLVLLPGVASAYNQQFEDMINNQTIIAIETPEPKPISVRFELLEYSMDILKAAGQHLGLIPLDEPTVAVILDETVVAILPQNSKFDGIVPTERCLVYQYGTDNWYDCEQRVLL
jgi:hypothetical protein